MYRFQKMESGIILDTQTRLEWRIGPDQTTTWSQAKSWAQDLNRESGGWRLPTRRELAGLYRAGSGERNMDPLFRTTGWYIWAMESANPNAPWEFNFFDGGTAEDKRHNPREFRAFAVRKIPSKDKRKHPRFETKLQAYIERPVCNRVREVENISAEGFFIQVQNPILTDSNVSIRLLLQDAQGTKDILVNGQVKFCLNDMDAGEVGAQPGIGVKLIGFPSREEEAEFQRFISMVSESGSSFAMIEHTPAIKRRR